MILFTPEILAALAANGQATLQEQRRTKHTREIDHMPVVKIFSPVGAATWLLTESTPDEPDRLFGLCDLGMGEPELGYVARSELEEIRVPVRIAGMGKVGELPLERDLHFKAEYPLSVYAEAAHFERRITEDRKALAQAAQSIGIRK